MSTREVDLCVSILDDHFGYYVSTVGHILLTVRSPLFLIIRKIERKFGIREVKLSLIILEQHGMLEFDHYAGIIYYFIRPSKVIRLIRIPRTILIVKTLYGEIAEQIMEEVLSNGRISCSDCIRKVIKCFESTNPQEVKNKFVGLVTAQMLIRCLTIKSNDGFPQFLPPTNPFLMPDSVMDRDDTSEEIAHKKTRKRKASPRKQSDSDAEILWSVNWPRIERFFRDSLVLDALCESEFIDQATLQVAKFLLKVGEVKSELEANQSNPISLRDVQVYEKENNNEKDREKYTPNYLDEKLNTIARFSNNIIRKVADSCGGLYIINYEKAIEYMCHTQLEATIREKLGSKAVRIFRLLSSKSFMEEEQLEKEAMLSSKETKELCCLLLASNFISLRQVARTTDFSPAKAIYLYTIVWHQLIFSMIDTLKMTIRNVIRRRAHEEKSHEELLDRQLKMQIIVGNIANDPNFDEESRKQQISEVEEAYMTASDKAELSKYRKGQQTFWATEIELERILLIYEQYQRIKTSNLIEQSKQRKKVRKKTICS